MNFYNDTDLNIIISLINTYKLRKIFITGPMGSGKSSFCKEFIKFCTGFEYINLDNERDLNNCKYRSQVLCGCINKNIDRSFILDFYDLLNEDYTLDKVQPNTLSVWRKYADCLILLNPIKDQAYQKSFVNLKGNVLYSNRVTETYFKLMI